jgi:hypothetical protein
LETPQKEKEKITSQTLAKASKELNDAFPTLHKGFYRILWVVIEENNWNDERLTRAVRKVIETCTYPCPTIANFILADKEFRESQPHINLINNEEIG